MRIDPDVALDVACVIGCAVQTGVGAALYTGRPAASVTRPRSWAWAASACRSSREPAWPAPSIIIASDPVPERREAALRFGATHAIDPQTDDSTALAMDLTGGVGVDVAFDAVGSPALIDAGLAATRTGGTTVMVGVAPLDQQFVIESPTVFAATAKRLVGLPAGRA